MMSWALGLTCLLKLATPEYVQLLLRLSSNWSDFETAENLSPDPAESITKAERERDSVCVYEWVCVCEWDRVWLWLFEGEIERTRMSVCLNYCAWKVGERVSGCLARMQQKWREILFCIYPHKEKERKESVPKKSSKRPKSMTWSFKRKQRLKPQSLKVKTFDER